MHWVASIECRERSFGICILSFCHVAFCIACSWNLYDSLDGLSRSSDHALARRHSKYCSGLIWCDFRFCALKMILTDNHDNAILSCGTASLLLRCEMTYLYSSILHQSCLSLPSWRSLYRTQQAQRRLGCIPELHKHSRYWGNTVNRRLMALHFSKELRGRSQFPKRATQTFVDEYVYADRIPSTKEQV